MQLACDAVRLAWAMTHGVEPGGDARNEAWSREQQAMRREVRATRRGCDPRVRLFAHPRESPRAPRGNAREAVVARGEASPV